MQWFRWSPLVLLFPSPPVPVPIFCDCTKSTNYNWYHRHFHVPQFFTILKVQIFIFLFAFFQFYTVVCRDSKFSFLFCLLSLGLVVWSRLGDLVIRLYLKLPEKIMRLIFQNRFCVVRIPFIRMVKFQFLAQFPVDHLSHSVLYSFWANLLHSFFCVIDLFVSINLHL